MLKRISQLSALAVLFSSWVAQATPAGEPVSGTPLVKHQARDRLGRTIQYYVGAAAKPAPVLLLLQGSGCSTVIRTQAGSTFSTLPGLLPLAAERKYNVIAVEKSFANPAGGSGTAKDCSAAFNKSFTAESWLVAIQAALTDVQNRPNVDRSRTIVLGHSEGAVMASLLAGRDPRVTDVIAISGRGTTQLFDFLVFAYQQCFDRTACLEDVEKQVREINSDPDSDTRFAWGHPFKRWSSFFRVDPGDELVRSAARVYVALGTADQSAPALSQELMIARLLAVGRDVTIHRLPDADHSLRQRGASGFSGLTQEMTRALLWADQAHSRSTIVR